MKDGSEVIEIPLELIEEPSKPVRMKMSEEGLEELKGSLAERDLINAITVRRKGSGFEIVAGHRRFLAARELGWKTIRSIVKERSDHEARLDAIHENLHREDMSPLEESAQVAELQRDFNYEIKDIAKLCRKSVSWVHSRLEMVEWPKNILEAVDVGAISVSAGRELCGILDDQARDYYLDHAIKQGATAQLCAFWRGRWEIEKITHDPSAVGSGSFEINPPPMEVLIPCFWCEREIPIRIIDHLRVCPTCRDLIGRAKAETLIEAAQEKRESSKNADALM